MHKHAAKKLHWDLRLEIGGYLCSWAIPKGPSFDPEIKRLAVRVEDHPLDYVDFEGVIPEGYGAGSMILWDRGLWHPHDEPESALREGSLHFRLDGYKLRGEWILIQSSPSKNSPEVWFLKKKPDKSYQSSPAVSVPDTSILSGLTVELLQHPESAKNLLLDQLDLLGLSSSKDHTEHSLSPMLAESHPAPFDDPSWIFELKYDGFRLISHKYKGIVHLQFRSGRTATSQFPEITASLQALPFDNFILDGEVVCLDTKGHPSFQRLQRRAQLRRDRDISRARWYVPTQYMVFDLLFAEGVDLRSISLLERKQYLRTILPAVGPLQFVEHISASGHTLFELVKTHHLEGMIAKHKLSTYQHRRSSDWIKVRREHTETFAIVGYTLPQGQRVGFGGLHLARATKGQWQYVGRVGSGFNTQQLEDIHQALEPLIVPKPICSIPYKNSVWTQPVHNAKVTYLTASKDGIIRQARFVSLDPSPAKCLSEQSQPPVSNNFNKPLLESPSVSISNPDKIFFPESGLTKQDVVNYFTIIAPWALQYLVDRPLSLHRFPDGIHGTSFFQKFAPDWIPSWIRTESICSDEHQAKEQIIVDSPEALTYMVNLGTLTFHTWTCRVPKLNQPDWVVLDLDPQGAPFTHVVRIALGLKQLTDEWGLVSAIKTSGATGLHVLIPLGAKYTHDQAKMVAQLLARVITERYAPIATVNRQRDQRYGKVYLDYGQNGRGKLLAAPYSVRAGPGALVSTPLCWNEVTEELRPDQWNIRTVVARMAQIRRCPLAAVLGPGPDLQTMLLQVPTLKG